MYEWPLTIAISWKVEWMLKPLQQQNYNKQIKIVLKLSILYIKYSCKHILIIWRSCLGSLPIHGKYLSFVSVVFITDRFYCIFHLPMENTLDLFKWWLLQIGFTFIRQHELNYLVTSIVCRSLLICLTIQPNSLE